MSKEMKDRLIKYAAMAIVNYTNDLTKVDVDIRQATNDDADSFAVSRITALINQIEELN